MLGVLLLLLVLGATVWTCGHLVLSLAVLPGVLKEKSIRDWLRFESNLGPVRHSRHFVSNRLAVVDAARPGARFLGKE